MANTMRTSISVPLDLKARMDADGDGINWSTVACRAFEARLAEVIQQRKARDMKDVVNRLRASQSRVDDAALEEGHAAGRDWAMNEAEADELRRLDALRARLRDHEWDLQFDGDSNSAYGPAENFVFIIRPEEKGDRQAALDFWLAVLGDDAEDKTSDGVLVRGFADGALEVWGEVESQL